MRGAVRLPGAVGEEGVGKRRVDFPQSLQRRAGQVHGQLARWRRKQPPVLGPESLAYARGILCRSKKFEVSVDALRYFLVKSACGWAFNLEAS